MPMYEHLCSNCDAITEDVQKIKDRKQFVVCDHCGGSAERIISSHIQRDEPTWLPDAIDHAVSHGSDVRKPENRTEFNRHLKENGISHVG